MANPIFTDEQQSYLQGLAMGADVARAAHSAAHPDDIHHEAQVRACANGKKLCNEERAKQDKNALDMWDQMLEAARNDALPKGADVFLYKFHGLFYVAPAQDAFMCRLRIPAGVMRADQLRGVAELAERYGGGYVDVTTRANLQVREIAPRHGVHVVMGLSDLGIITRGAGGDNVRNITASPTCGIDPQEVVDTLGIARQMHHAILHHRELYGLPRKFNIAFDGGGRVSSLQDTNDIGFTAVRLGTQHADSATPAGVYFRLELGGITGHKDFARDTGLLLNPDQCVAVAIAILKVFIAHGNRTDRSKARLKYLLDDWGLDRFVDAVEKELGFTLPRVDKNRCEPRGLVDRFGHIGVHQQKQPGKKYIGVPLPVGRMTCAQMRAVADLAQRYGSGDVRLTVWQNLLISDIDHADVQTVRRALMQVGLGGDATAIRAGLVACTGNSGCKYAAANTKAHALVIADYLDEQVDLDTPINIHLTGCHHSCAQHYIGDIGLLAANVETGEGYHVYVGGGYGSQQAIGRELMRDIPFAEIPAMLARLIGGYLDQRQSPAQTFSRFAGDCSLEELRSFCGNPVAVSQ